MSNSGIGFSVNRHHSRPDLLFVIVKVLRIARVSRWTFDGPTVFAVRVRTLTQVTESTTVGVTIAEIFAIFRGFNRCSTLDQIAIGARRSFVFMEYIGSDPVGRPEIETRETQSARRNEYGRHDDDDNYSSRTCAGHVPVAIYKAINKTRCGHRASTTITQNMFQDLPIQFFISLGELLIDACEHPTLIALISLCKTIRYYIVNEEDYLIPLLAKRFKVPYPDGFITRYVAHHHQLVQSVRKFDHLAKGVESLDYPTLDFIEHNRMALMGTYASIALKMANRLRLQGHWNGEACRLFYLCTTNGTLCRHSIFSHDNRGTIYPFRPEPLLEFVKRDPPEDFTQWFDKFFVQRLRDPHINPTLEFLKRCLNETTNIKYSIDTATGWNLVFVLCSKSYSADYDSKKTGAIENIYSIYGPPSFCHIFDNLQHLRTLKGALNLVEGCLDNPEYSYLIEMVRIIVETTKQERLPISGNKDRIRKVMEKMAYVYYHTSTLDDKEMHIERFMRLIE